MARDTDSSSTSAPVQRTDRLRDVMLVIACAALSGALAEFAFILGARIVLARYTMLNPQGVWLAPIANVIVMAPAILLAWVLARWRSPRWALPSAVAVGAMLATLEPLLILRGRVHIAAIFILAAGVAVQLARFALKRPATARAALRWIAAGLAMVAGAGGGAFNMLRWGGERRAVQSLRAAPDAPNVLLLVLDTVRALSLSAYGYGRPTSPSIAQLAVRGVRFERAVATAPWTLPTHATLFTGRYPHELSAGWSVPLDATYATLGERLTSIGYATAGFAANLRYTSYEFGLSRGFGYYRDYDVSLGEMLHSSSLSLALTMWLIQRTGGYSTPNRLSADRMNERLLSWLDDASKRPPKRPFFAFVNYYDAHGPYEPPAPFDTMYSGKEPPTRDPASRDFTQQEVDGLNDAYDASITYLDRRLGDLFAALAQRGLLENTIVIVTSDHGEEFNEHGQMNHGNTLYFPSLHVPLIVAGARVPRAVTVSEPVTLRDLPATILDLVRAASGNESALPGRSLAGLWRSERDSLGAPHSASPIIGEVDYARNLPSSIPVSQGAMKSVVVDGYHFIRGADGSEEMYDIRTDPWERRNVLQSPELAATLERARALVAEARARDVRRGGERPRPSR